MLERWPCWPMCIVTLMIPMALEAWSNCKPPLSNIKLRLSSLTGMQLLMKNELVMSGVATALGTHQ